MKFHLPYRTFLKIAFVFSLVLFFPLFEPSETFTILPNSPSRFMMSIHSPKISITSDQAETISLNVTYINPATGETEKITKESFFFNGATGTDLDTKKPGTYLFEFYTGQIVSITIDPINMYSLSLVIFFLVTTVNIFILTRDYVIYMEN